MSNEKPRGMVRRSDKPAALARRVARRAVWPLEAVAGWLFARLTRGGWGH